MPAHAFTPSPTFESHPGAYCIHCGRMRDEHPDPPLADSYAAVLDVMVPAGPSVPEQSFGGGAEPAGMVGRAETDPDEIQARARRLRARGRDDARHVVGNWFEVGSRSDGMSGRVTYENDRTTELVSYSWSVTSPTCQSEHEAREAARADLRRGSAA